MTPDTTQLAFSRRIRSCPDIQTVEWMLRIQNCIKCAKKEKLHLVVFFPLCVRRYYLPLPSSRALAVPDPFLIEQLYPNTDSDQPHRSFGPESPHRPTRPHARPTRHPEGFRITKSPPQATSSTGLMDIALRAARCQQRSKWQLSLSLTCRPRACADVVVEGLDLDRTTNNNITRPWAVEHSLLRIQAL